MKKMWISSILIIAMLLSGCSDKEGSEVGGKQPVLVAESMEENAENEIPENAFQDFRHFTYGDITALNTPKVKNKSSEVDYYAYDSDVEPYVEMLRENGFTLISTYKNGELISYALNYDAFGDGVDTVLSIYDMVKCHLVIWSQEKGEFEIEYVNDLVMWDLGLRNDGKIVETALQGESARAGLYRLADGSYQTSDERLTASVGSAMVIIDGETVTASTKYELDKKEEGIWIEYGDDEGMYILTRLNDFNTGDVLQIRDVERRYKEYKTDEKYNIKNYSWDMPLFMMAYDGIWGGPKLSKSDFEALTIRCMYRGEDEAVVYVYAKLVEASIEEVEVLSVVSTEILEEEEKVVGDKFTDDEIVMSVGETILIEDTRSKFGSDYHVYEWEIEEGKDLVDIEFNGNKCYVTASAKGEAVIVSEYSYTEETTDVLTGNKRDAHKTKKERFTIIIK